MLVVVSALTILHLGDAGAGWLNAAWGAGGLAGGVAGLARSCTAAVSRRVWPAARRSPGSRSSRSPRSRWPAPPWRCSSSSGSATR